MGRLESLLAAAVAALCCCTPAHPLTLTCQPLSLCVTNGLSRQYEREMANAPLPGSPGSPEGLVARHQGMAR